MLTEPSIIQRPEQLYDAVASTLNIKDLSATIPESIDRLQKWLQKLAAAAVGAPFVRYRVIDMPSEVHIEVGMPLAMELPGSDGILSAKVPAGRYVTAVYTGAPSGLIGANAALLHWAHEQGVKLQMHHDGHAEVWQARLEIMHSDANTKPENQRTEIAFQIA